MKQSSQNEGDDDNQVCSLFSGSTTARDRWTNLDSGSGSRNCWWTRGLFDLNLQFPSLGVLTGIIVAIIVGIIALIGAGQVSNVVLNVVLLILGYIAGGIGEIMILLGAVVALVAKFVKL